MERIPESDWKVLRQLALVALDRLCAQIVGEITVIASNEAITMHERFGEIYGLIGDRNKDIARTFDGPSRSSAPLKLLQMRSLDLVSDEELGGSPRMFGRLSNES
ncbi:hypothetical protein [Fimbriimonas ginsengisoli]|uniref:hypothetical protein n=1 Tax=Fimbriimonas ginsengisoli TaxID=1005039 RepID=UPI0003E93230|nr:hypothetical protein [Fimbriimonas ginsengisoli]